MAYERLWAAVSQPFLSNGTTKGTLQVSDSTGFYVKQQVSLISNTIPTPLPLEIKRIDADGTIYVGTPGANILDRRNIAAYLVSDGAIISAPEQSFSFIKPDEIVNAEYERDPIKAQRVVPVDAKGNFIGPSNGLPVQLLSGFGLPLFDDVQKVLDPNDLPLSFKFFKSLVQVAQIDVTYNTNGTSIEFKRSL